MTSFWTITLVVGVVFQVLIISALLRGPYRHFKVLLVYLVTVFLVTAANAAAFYSREIWTKTSGYSRYYWVGDAVLQILVFVLVISLVQQGMAGSPTRSAARRGLIGGAVVFALLSSYFTQEPRFGLWMTKLSRNLGFCAVILNLILWAVLIKFRHSDKRLLLISGGLGIEMAGKAIGHSMRQLSRSMIFAGDLIIVLSHLACLYIWWQAFRTHQEGPLRE